MSCHPDKKILSSASTGNTPVCGRIVIIINIYITLFFEITQSADLFVCGL